MPAGSSVVPQSRSCPPALAPRNAIVPSTSSVDLAGTSDAARSAANRGTVAIGFMARSKSPPRTIAVFILALLSACWGPPREPSFASVALPPLPAEMARIYFYRFYQPYESLARPWIYLNRREALISIPGAVLMLDVAPGAYEIYVYSQGDYPGQFKHVVLRSGDALYVRVDASKSWWSGLRYQRDTFVATLVAPERAHIETANLRYESSNEP